MQKLFAKGIALKLLVFCMLSAAAVWLIPQIDPSVGGPGPVTILGVGLVITLFTAGVLYLGINSGLNLPKKFLLFTLVYNVLIVVVKFAISPLAVYQANQAMDFGFEINRNPLMLALMTGGVFLLYLLVFSGIYLFFKRKAAKQIPPAPPGEQKTGGHKALVIWGIVLLVGIIVLIGGGTILLFPLLFSLFSLEYLSFVFATVYGALIALVLLAAINFLIGAFKSAAEQAVILRDITVLASFFWVGAAFLLIYHALWVVYFLALTTLWPLRVVTPK